MKDYNTGDDSHVPLTRDEPSRTMQILAGFILGVVITAAIVTFGVVAFIFYQT